MRIGSVWDWGGAWLLSTWLLGLSRNGAVGWGSGWRGSAVLLLEIVIVVRHLKDQNKKELANHQIARGTSLYAVQCTTHV